MKFRGEFYFLSNMCPAPITVNFNGEILKFTCSESLYQALKCPSRIHEFVALDGYQAKRLGKTVKIRDDWNEVRIPIMRKILSVKFTQHPELLARLKNIKTPIEEENHWGDVFWGTCNGHGENMLGKLLMEIRDTF